MVRSLSGKLQSGTALDAYNRLPVATQTDYTILSEALIDKFIDPQEKSRFLEDFEFNKRKKGQSLKDFMQEIIKDQGRYAKMRDTIGVGVAAVPNQEKVRDGIRRFKRGIRNRKGKIHKDQIRQHAEATPGPASTTKKYSHGRSTAEENGSIPRKGSETNKGVCCRDAIRVPQPDHEVRASRQQRWHG